MKQLSLALFKNEELLSLLIECIIAYLIIRYLFRFVKETKPINKKENKYKDPYIQQSKRPKPFSKKDKYYLTLITCIYAICSFHQLGSTKFPHTTWQPVTDQQEVIFKLPQNTSFDQIYAIYGEGDNNALETGYQLGCAGMQLYGSNDLISWQFICDFDEHLIHEYQIKNGEYEYQYIKLLSTSSTQTLTELAFYSTTSKTFLPIEVEEDQYSQSNYPATLLIDEQDVLVESPTYFNEGYFDEVYHVRNGWEIANGQRMYSFVHPLFGTSLIGLSIKLFGLNPFAWRLPGALFGVLLLPLMYKILKLLFDKTYYATIGTIYLAAEFMHFTTSRIGTLEPFSVFFILFMYYYMIEYCYTSYYDTPFKDTLKILLKCGIVMGIGFATKWTVCYSAIGLAILFFITWFKRIKELKTLKGLKDDQETWKSLSNKQKERYDKIITNGSSYNRKTFLWCFVFFIFIPAIIYWISFIPCPVWADGWSIKNVFDQNSYMYNYHVDLEATHPFQSDWYYWIFDIRPMWYYSGSKASSTYHTISCFLNPVLCWTGVLSILLVLVDVIRSKTRNLENIIILVGYLTALLPWINLVNRCVFIYHFYPTSLFMLMSIVYSAKRIIDQKESGKEFINAYTLIVVLTFIIFLPLISGFGTTYDYSQFFELLPTWNF